MPNNVDITAGAGTTISTTAIGSGFSAYSTSGQAATGILYCSASTGTAPTPVTNANPLPVGVQGTVSASQSGTWNVGTVTAVTSITNAVTIADGGGSITVDGSVFAAQSGTWDIGTVTLLGGIATAVAVTDNSGSLTVDDGGSSLTVDGTVAATQSGSWTVTANAGTGTMAVSAASLPLPSGAATEASLAKLTVSPGTALGSNTAAMVAGSVVSSAPSYSAGNINPVTVDTAGNLRAKTPNIAAPGILAIPSEAASIGLAVSTTFSRWGGRSTVNGAAGQVSIEGVQGSLGQSIASLSLPTVLASDQPAVPVSLNTAAINSGTTALTPKFAQVTTSGTGDTQVVALVSGKKIRVLSYSVSFNATATVFFKTAATGTQLSRNIYGVQYASQGQSFSPVGHFETLAGEALSINLSGTSPASVNVCYVEV